MIIETNEFGTRIIIPDEGKMLTDGNIITDSVYLGDNADPSEWAEIDIPEEYCI